MGIADAGKQIIFDKGFGMSTCLGLFLSREILSISNITRPKTGIPDREARFGITITVGECRFVKPDA